MIHEPLVLDQPGRPSRAHLNRPVTIGHGVGGVRDVTIESFGRSPAWRVERQLPTCLKVELPSSDIVFSVNPKAQTAMKLASTDTGSARPVMIVERQEFRKRKTTSTVSRAPSTRASCTLATARLTR